MLGRKEPVSVNATELYEVKQIENLRELVERSYKEHNNPVSFVLKGKREFDSKYKDIYMSEFMDHYKGLGAKLLDMGYYGSDMAILSENRYEWAVSYISTIAGLGRVIPMDKNLPEGEILNLLKRVNVKVLFVSPKVYENIIKVKDEEGFSVDTLVVMDIYTSDKDGKEIDKINNSLESGKLGSLNVASMKQLISEGSEILKTDDKYLNLPIDREAPAEVLFTSATTSTSKAVLLSHKNICSNIRDICSMFRFTSSDRFLSFLPLNHSFEATVGFLFPLFSGIAICYAESLRKISDNIKEYGITIIIAVPALFDAIYDRILKSIEKKGKMKQFQFGLALSNTLRKLGMDKRREIFKDIHNELGGKLKTAVIGAAALSQRAHKGLNEIGVDTYQGYGLTETGPVVSAGYDKYNVLGSVGKVLPSVKVKIDKQNEDEPIGEIWVKGPNVMIGYENDEENNKATFTDDGWLKTGDLGYIDEEGYLFIAGRTKNIIVLSNGKNVFPDESETLLNSIHGATESMVFGLPEDGDETNVSLAAEIVYDEAEFNGMSEEEIHDQIWEDVKEINKLQPTYKYIKRIFVTKEPLIKTTTLKIKRYEEMDKIKREFLDKEDNK